MRVRKVLRFLTQRKRMPRAMAAIISCAILIYFTLVVFFLHIQSATTLDFILRKPFSFRDSFLVIPNRTHTMISAFLDTRPEGYGYSVKVLGYGNFDDLNPVYCKVFYGNGDVACLQYPAIVNTVGHSKRNRQTVFNIYQCRITKEESAFGTPIAVSFPQTQDCGYTPSALQIVHVDKLDSIKRKNAVFCVCLPNVVFQQEETDVQDWVEFLEMSKILGTDYIQAFNTSNTWSLFQKLPTTYIQSQFLRLVNWTVTGDSGLNGVLTERTVLANDCLYRNLGNVKHMVVVDSNELLIPHKQNTWRAMMQRLQFLHNSSLVGAYMFRTVPYYDESPGNMPNSMLVPHSKDHHDPKRQTNTYRLPRIVTHRLRAKSTLSANEHAQLMLDPRKVSSVSANGITVMLPGYLYYTVPVEFASIHRFDPRGKLSIKDLVVDSSMDKFVTQLLSAMHQKFYSTS